MDLGLRGRRALITGGSRGIGFAVAEALAAEGAAVGLVARDAAGLAEAAGRLEPRGVPVATAAADVTALPQGHDAWVVGDEPVVVVDWYGASNYARG